MIALLNYVLYSLRSLYSLHIGNMISSRSHVNRASMYNWGKPVRVYINETCVRDLFNICLYNYVWYDRHTKHCAFSNPRKTQATCCNVRMLYCASVWFPTCSSCRQRRPRAGPATTKRDHIRQSAKTDSHWAGGKRVYNARASVLRINWTKSERTARWQWVAIVPPSYIIAAVTETWFVRLVEWRKNKMAKIMAVKIALPSRLKTQWHYKLYSVQLSFHESLNDVLNLNDDVLIVILSLSVCKSSNIAQLSKIRLAPKMFCIRLVLLNA